MLGWSFRFGLDRSKSMKKAAGIPFPSKRYVPLNRCAYCDATEDLSEEHVIPLGLGGDLVLPRGSCERHRKATCKVEDFVLRRYLCALRSHLSLPSRRPHLRPDGYPLVLKRGPHSWKQKVNLADHPGIVRFVIFDPPGRVAGRPPVQENFLAPTDNHAHLSRYQLAPGTVGSGRI